LHDAGSKNVKNASKTKLTKRNVAVTGIRKSPTPRCYRLITLGKDARARAVRSSCCHLLVLVGQCYSRWMVCSGVAVLAMCEVRCQKW
jgi:hypothetical protein